MRIGVDIDGVLADQVGEVLKLVNKAQGTSLRRADIDEWDKIIGTTRIDEEIERALEDDSYVLRMACIPGARKGMQALSRAHNMVIVTSRPPKSLAASMLWLKQKDIPFDEFCGTQPLGKAGVLVDVLVDYRIENVEEFANAGRKAILLSQPWNQERSKLQPLLQSGAVAVAEKWSGVVNIVNALPLPAERQCP